MEKFIQKAKKVHGNKYDYSLLNFVNNQTKVKIICKKHGLFLQTPANHLQGCGCSLCTKKRLPKLTNFDFIQKAKKVHGDRYDYSLSEYKNSQTKVKIICKKHGVFQQVAGNHLNGNGCKKCFFDNRLLNTKTFIQKAKKVHGNKYDYSLTYYTKSSDKVTIICKKHGLFEQTANSHLSSKNGCPVCRNSKGEECVRLFLKKNDILFEEQKRFENCRNKLPLPFDFYLPEQNILIEFDGKQHYGFGKYATRVLKKNDKIKNNFAKENGIRLIRIPYTELNNVYKLLSVDLDIDV